MAPRLALQKIVGRPRLKGTPCETVDVIHIASTRDEAGPGAPGQVEDLQGHHQDDQEQLLDHFKAGFRGVLRGF